MKLMTKVCLATALLVGASASTQAQSLLGGILGGSGDSALVTIGSGDAGQSGLVNVGVGGSNLVDVNVGNGEVASATVGTSNGVSADVRLLNDNARVGIGVGGDSVLDVDIGIGGGGNGGGGNGGGGNGGGNGGAGSNPGVLPGGGMASTGGSPIVCQGVSSAQIERLIRGTRIDNSWSRASAVEIQKVSVCPELRAWLVAALNQTGIGHSLRSAIVSDELLTASLNRSPHSADRVFAVHNSRGRLTVFVY
ncbi:hypothetical protein SAMN06295905_1764 [Devosia lucknowensis]|uniref:Uncharacterized protein n=1 Tax=Devosia lucknowensis TaxID=1096929 RepID=A0A1Y6F909_9HYPH|nr:hypothetical protein [Devosia lucknowensis]SMQ70081.1 hypothetical protein SAMN06295905_1764 [Devosia lucknowensis]